MRFDQFAQQGRDVLDQHRLGESAIGEGRIVGDVEEISVRPRGGDFAIDRETAETGIEHHNGLPCRHRTTNDTTIWRLQSAACRLRPSRFRPDAARPWDWGSPVLAL